jgi:hypothetical protein
MIVLIAEKFRSNVQRTAQILPEKLGRLCSCVAFKPTICKAAISRFCTDVSVHRNHEAEMNLSCEKRA